MAGTYYPYGTQLPSENDFAQLFNCSRNTIRRALSMLVTDGYVQAVHGKGVDVIYQAPGRTSFTVGGIESFKETALRNKLSIKTKVIECHSIVIDKKLAKTNGFTEGNEAYFVKRVRYLDTKPLIMDTNIFLSSIVPDLTEEIASKSIYDYIENELGMQITTSKRTITVEHATAIDKRYLDLGSYDCMAVITSQTFNRDGIMFEYTVSRHHPEYFCFQNTATRRKS